MWRAGKEAMRSYVETRISFVERVQLQKKKVDEKKTSRAIFPAVV